VVWFGVRHMRGVLVRDYIVFPHQGYMLLAGFGIACGSLKRGQARATGSIKVLRDWRSMSIPASAGKSWTGLEWFYE